jgi:dihydromethanopterin reductase (acceptor)
MQHAIAWGITGAGHLLRESFDMMEILKKRHPELKITTFISSAGEEVCRLYGLIPKLNKISRGEYLEEIIVDEGKGAYSKTGRFQLGRYRTLIVSPTTTNTIAKVVCGIADNLITNAISQATKARVPTLIVPVEGEFEALSSKTPLFVDRAVCEECEVCIPEDSCPQKAINQYEIDTSLCDGCGICIDMCPYNAIKTAEVRIKPR